MLAINKLQSEILPNASGTQGMHRNSDSGCVHAAAWLLLINRVCILTMAWHESCAWLLGCYMREGTSWQAQRSVLLKLGCLGNTVRA